MFSNSARVKHVVLGLQQLMGSTTKQVFFGQSVWGQMEVEMALVMAASSLDSLILRNNSNLYPYKLYKDYYKSMPYGIPKIVLISGR